MIFTSCSERQAGKSLDLAGIPHPEDLAVLYNVGLVREMSLVSVASS